MGNSPLQKQVAARIKAILAKRGMTAESLCTEIEYSLPNFYNFLNGKRGLSLETLERVSKGLEVSLRELFPM
jgi:transcriptional regulator with XRE-family HTH domain